MIPLQAVALAVVLLVGVATVLTRDPLRQAFVSAVYGPALVVLFLVFQAPDVAMSAMVVGAVASPVLVLLALAKVHARERKERRS